VTIAFHLISQELSQYPADPNTLVLCWMITASPAGAAMEIFSLE
jgi:hypothetical protein